MTKKIIWEEVTVLGVDGTNIDSLMKTLITLKNDYGNCKFEKETYPYSDSEYVSVQRERLETDEEESSRELGELRNLAVTKAKEKAEYERLKAKFGETK